MNNIKSDTVLRRSPFSFLLFLINSTRIIMCKSSELSQFIGDRKTKYRRSTGQVERILAQDGWW